MTNLKIFTDNIEEKALEQINELVSQDAFKDAKVRIMPDVHAGMGCVIGFTADLGDKVIPNVVGVDIGCGMLTIELGVVDIDFEMLDDMININVPSGFKAHNSVLATFPKLRELYVYNELRNIDHIEKSLGTLGGGNHFIEVAMNSAGGKYLIIHTGSRNLGKQVAEIYQAKAIKACSFDKEVEEGVQKFISEAKEMGLTTSIEKGVRKIREQFMGLTKLPKDLCYLEGELREQYLHDMKICREFATLNRHFIAEIILTSYFGYSRPNFEEFETIHNYIDDNNIVRKGAISAKAGERVLIPINMKDGSILAEGLGNGDWNESAPHGAGRIMSRMQAKKQLSMEEFKETMEGVYSSSVVPSTLDEAPMAYKPIEEILENIEDTVDVLDTLVPLYNFKAKE